MKREARRGYEVVVRWRDERTPYCRTSARMVAKAMKSGRYIMMPRAERVFVRAIAPRRK